jgi:hypothetical protein
LSDKETRDVVATLTRTFETLSKGIIYEHQAESPRLQAIINWVADVLSQRDKIEQAPRVSDADVLGMLQTVSTALQDHRDQADRGSSYLDTAERVFRAGASEVPSIELPGGPPTGGLIVEP